MKWRLFLLRRELRLWLLCKTIGHKIVWRQNTSLAALVMDGEIYSMWCARCDRVFGQIGFSNATRSARLYGGGVEAILEEKARELRWAPVVSRRARHKLDLA